MYADVTASAAHHRYHGIDEPVAAASRAAVSGIELTCMRYSVDANPVITHLTALILVLGGAQSTSPPRLNPNLPHVDIYPPAHWNLRLFARRDMSGRPAIELNDQGLFVDGTRVCAWPGGRWNPDDAANMLLGYDERRTYIGCGADMPVLSIAGDNGLGAAAVYIEVVRRVGTVAEARYGSRTLYLDLNSLPRGGWDWLISEREQARRDAEAAQKLRQDPVFARFVRDVRACLSSSRTPGCFASFLESPFYDWDAAAKVARDYYVTAEQFVDYAASAPARGASSGKLWDEIVACFTNDRLLVMTPREARFEGDVNCDVKRTAAGWKVTSIFVGE
jgi:hypothetical protein